MSNACTPLWNSRLLCSDTHQMTVLSLDLFGLKCCMQDPVSGTCFNDVKRLDIQTWAWSGVKVCVLQRHTWHGCMANETWACRHICHHHPHPVQKFISHATFNFYPSGCMLFVQNSYVYLMLPVRSMHAWHAGGGNIPTTTPLTLYWLLGKRLLGELPPHKLQDTVDSGYS